MGASEKAYDLEQRFNQHAYTHRYTIPATGATSLGTSMVTASGLTATLDTGASYQFHSLVSVNITGSGGVLTYRVHAAGGLTASSFRVVTIELDGTSVGSIGTNNALDGTITGSTVGTGLADRFITYDGYLDVSVGGTMSIQLALSAGSAALYRFSTYLDITQTA